MVELHQISPSWNLLVRDAHFIPLLFAIVIHPLLVMLSMLTTNGDIVCLHLSPRAQLVAQILVDNPFMFLQASCENLEKRECVHGINLPPHLACILIGGSRFSYQILRGPWNVLDDKNRWLKNALFFNTWGIYCEWMLQMANWLNGWLTSWAISYCIGSYHLTWLVWNHLTTLKYLGGGEGGGLQHYLCRWWLIDFRYCKTCFTLNNRGYLLSNISLRMV